MRGAPFGLRPCRIRKPLEIKRCRERPMCRSVTVEVTLIVKSFCTLQGRNPKGAPRILSCLPSIISLPYHFYPVAGARQGGKPPPSKSRSTGFCAGAAGIRSTANGYTKNSHYVKIESITQLQRRSWRFLGDFSLRSPLSRVRDRVPRS